LILSLTVFLISLSLLGEGWGEGLPRLPTIIFSPTLDGSALFLLENRFKTPIKTIADPSRVGEKNSGFVVLSPLPTLSQREREDL
jgi:hypothetical protein